MSDVKPRLELFGIEGNAFCILANARKVAKRAGWSEADIQEFVDEAKSGDYDYLLLACETYFEVY